MPFGPPGAEFVPKPNNGSGLGSIDKKTYCLGDFVACARHQVKDAVGKQAVPVDLYPNMHNRAEGIIAAAQPV